MKAATWARNALGTFTSAALFAALPLVSFAAGNGALMADEHANEHAVAAGGNLGQGAAPLPEPGTWLMIGTLVLIVGWVARSQRRRGEA
jgi:hypothetical protein